MSEKAVMVGLGALTAATGAQQAVAPDLTLKLLHADESPGVRHFFGTVGMFMACTGGVLVARPQDRAVVGMTALQKAGASAAVALAVKRGVLSPLALTVAAFDGLSALVALRCWRRLR